MYSGKSVEAHDAYGRVKGEISGRCDEKVFLNFKSSLYIT